MKLYQKQLFSFFVIFNILTMGNVFPCDAHNDSNLTPISNFSQYAIPTGAAGGDDDYINDSNNSFVGTIPNFIGNFTPISNFSQYAIPAGAIPAGGGDDYFNDFNNSYAGTVATSKTPLATTPINNATIENKTIENKTIDNVYAYAYDFDFEQNIHKENFNENPGRMVDENPEENKSPGRMAKAAIATASAWTSIAGPKAASIAGAAPKAAIAGNMTSKVLTALTTIASAANNVVQNNLTFPEGSSTLLGCSKDNSSLQEGMADAIFSIKVGVGALIFLSVFTIMGCGYIIKKLSSRKPDVDINSQSHISSLPSETTELLERTA